MSTISAGFLATLAADARAEIEKTRAKVAPNTRDSDLEWMDALCELERVATLVGQVLADRPKPTEWDLDRELVKRLCELDDLTEWEASFVESIADWVKTKPLTPKQRERAEQIEADDGE